MITIYQQPINTTFVRPSPMNMFIGSSTDVSTNYLKYEWEYTERGGSTWHAIPNPTAITPNMSITAAEAPIYGNNDFRCTVTEFDSLDVIVGTPVISTTAQATLFAGRTNVETTKSREAGRIRTRLGRHHEFENDPSLDSIFIAGNIGQATLATASDNVTFPNVQSAIVDVATCMTTPINGVVIFAEDQDPAGKSQQSRLLFTGTVTSPTPGSPVTFDIFGHRLIVPDSTLSTTFRDLVAGILYDFEAKNLYVKNTTTSGTEAVLYEHRDNKHHLVDSWVQYGITMTGSITSPAQYGYGQWTKIAEVTITDINSNPLLLHYWKRIS